ncbi:tripartite tricarboxylate transporter TctB family protein [Tabrizicola sp.]|uniref:tripartite tricarboxylate transporter TctB family protein n=1 Tax=Tabrizicola sp. TaxID=2005166 RepID=UPI0035AFF69C
MRKLDLAPGLFLIALSLGVILGTSGLAVWDSFTPGARFFPLVVGGLGLLLAALLFWQQWRGTDPGQVDRPDRAALVRVGLTIAGLAALALGAPRIGMVPTIAAFSLFILLVVLRQRLLPSVVTTAVIAGGTHLVFARLLAVPLPAPFGL